MNLVNDKKILLISYGDINYDGRLRSLISVFSMLGEVSTFTRGSFIQSMHGELCNESYFRFIKEAFCYAKKQGNIDYLVLDNRKATIPGILIRAVLNPKIVIQDCRELYLLRETKHLVGKIGCIFERMMAKRADIVICANQERAKIMKEEYNLLKTPLFYENLRVLMYESEEALENAKKRLTPLLGENDEIRIISSSGCSLQRTNDVLVKNLEKVNQKCRLFLVGENLPEEEKTIKKLFESNKKDSLIILGRLNQTELKYLISQSHIGIVNYGQYDTNNKFCASGKLYEFIYEGVPVVTTTNPPLKRLCEEEGIGEADNGYAEAINKVIYEYDRYKKNVGRYASEHTIAENDDKLIAELREYVSNK